MNYNEAYNKIIEAYFRDEIKPMSQEFCFCGTLCDKSSRWTGVPFASTWEEYKPIHRPFAGYDGVDFERMEKALFSGIATLIPNFFTSNNLEDNHHYEDAIFAGMCKALDELKQIHLEKGEVIDPTPSFTKRQLI